MKKKTFFFLFSYLIYIVSWNLRFCLLWIKLAFTWWMNQCQWISKFIERKEKHDSWARTKILSSSKLLHFCVIINKLFFFFFILVRLRNSLCCKKDWKKRANGWIYTPKSDTLCLALIRCINFVKMKNDPSWVFKKETEKKVTSSQSWVAASFVRLSWIALELMFRWVFAFLRKQFHRKHFRTFGFVFFFSSFQCLNHIFKRPKGL